jgi:serine/threonine-protein kinase
MCAARVKAGDVLGGKYQVERILGTGGMGMVVAARHIELGQTVALKFMLPEALADPDNAERFLREAQAAVQLRSIHTARILDVGRFENDEPFMVMEYLEGQDLDDEVAKHGPVPPHMAVDYVLQASEALAEAHGLGMVHRDVKLKNLFLTRTVDGRPLVKVLDFGLAKTTRYRAGVSLTATNSVFGSPQYMSPEQMRSAKDVDLRSDVWSMGVCLFEMLTSRLPFDAEGVAEICAMVLKDPVLPPSHLVAGIPHGIEDAVLRCLEKDRELRFQSFAELAAALEPYASANQGAARRIVNVMQSARASISDAGTSLEHVVAQGEPWDATPRPDGWDTEMQLGSPEARSSRTPLGIALAALAAAIVVFVFVFWLPRAQGSPETAAATGPPSPVNTATPLPPTQEAPAPSPVAASTPAQAPTTGTLIGASPADSLDIAAPPRPGARRASPSSSRTPASVRTGGAPVSTAGAASVRALNF